MERIRVLIAEDEAIVRKVLVDLVAAEPRLELVGEASNADEAIGLAHHHHPDVALLDVRMPAGGGPRAAQAIRQDSPTTKIIALSAYGDRDTVTEMLRSGASGYLVKGSTVEEILDGILRCADGEGSLSPMIVTDVIGELAGRLEREREESFGQRQRRERIRNAMLPLGFSVVFQPIVELATGRVAGVEALARFTGPPTQTPDLWFAEAAELGSLLDLELATGSAALGRLRDLPADTYLSVNFSPSTVCSSRLLEELEGVRTDHVVVEITEHAAVEDYKELCESLEVLRARGLRVAIDDAGAGFSSLQHILWLMPELIKLDISLTRGIHLDRHRQSLARALISFAADLGADVVAEGVETAEEMDALVKLGVSLGQGYFLGRPGSLPDSGPTPPSPWASRAA